MRVPFSFVRIMKSDIRVTFVYRGKTNLQEFYKPEASRRKFSGMPKQNDN